MPVVPPKTSGQPRRSNRADFWFASDSSGEQLAPNFSLRWTVQLGVSHRPVTVAAENYTPGRASNLCRFRDVPA